MNNILKLIMGLGALGCCLLLVNNFFSLFFSNGNEALHKKRLRQLQFNQKRTSSDDDSKREFINKFTNPVITHVMPKLKRNTDTSQIEKDLEMAQWNKTFTPVTFVAMDITLKILGIIMFCILAPVSLPFAGVWGLALFFGFKFLFNNSRKEREFKLLCQFPEFIRITQGFLLSGKPLSEAIESSLPYVGAEWKPLLREFVINSEVYSQSECITSLQDRVDIFEVKELWSLIKLNSDQGIDIRECFANQADKVRELQLEVIMDKIGKRQMMSIAIQGPLLLTMIVAFGLPTLYDMVNLGAM